MDLNVRDLICMPLYKPEVGLFVRIAVGGKTEVGAACFFRKHIVFIR
jgi:hypothetical protein